MTKYYIDFNNKELKDTIKKIKTAAKFIDENLFNEKTTVIESTYLIENEPFSVHTGYKKYLSGMEEKFKKDTDNKKTPIDFTGTFTLFLSSKQLQLAEYYNSLQKKSLHPGNIFIHRFNIEKETPVLKNEDQSSIVSTIQQSNDSNLQRFLGEKHKIYPIRDNNEDNIKNNSCIFSFCC